jgi:serine-type D-Ala-D-Ala carboxypeptidase (penicillin-binding protein 5/6)
MLRRSYLSSIVSSLLICVWAFAASAEERPAEPTFETKAPYAILVDARSGSVFFEKAADVSVPPASMSKLMTQAIVFDALKEGKIKEHELIPISEYAWRNGGAPSGGSTMYAELNSRVSVINLLRGAIIQSANDACIALAETLSGTEANFVALMNQQAKTYGLKNSTFGNSTGLPSEVHKMSMRDLSILARYIISEHPGYFKLYSEREFNWNKIKQQNRNPLLLDYPGSDGMKTGFTREAGYGLVGTAERDGRRLVLVVGGMDSISARKEEAQKLLNFGFSQFKPFDVYEAGQEVSSVRVWGGEQRSVGLITQSEFKISLSPQEQKSAVLKLEYKGPLFAPVKAGIEIGKVRVLVEGQILADIPVYTSADIAATDSMWRKAFDSVLMMVAGG